MTPPRTLHRLVHAGALALWLCLLLLARASHAEVAIPKAPDRWVTDETGFLSTTTRDRLDGQLQAYEQKSGHQVVVWVGGTLDGASLADFAVKTFQTWKVGRKGHDDGVLLVVLAKDHAVDIEVGYGLEDRLTDALSHRIIDEIMAPRFRGGDADGAVSAGVDAILADIEGQAGATGPVTAQPAPHAAHLSPVRMLIYGVLLVLFLLLLATHPSLAMYFSFSISTEEAAAAVEAAAGAVSVAAAVAPAAAVREEDGDMFGFFERLPRLLDVTRVRRAIADAEKLTTGEIRVSVSPFFWGSVDRAAERAFVRLGMERTRDRNGILFFIVPSRRAFVVLGDVGIHERVGDAVWNRLIDDMRPHFRRGDPTAAVLFGIERVGAELARHFPPDGGPNPNELPNFVDVAKG